jgi:hypothetical protein
MKILRVAILLLILTALVSCETDKSRIENCNQIVNSFMANLTLDNYDVLYKNYPDFKKVQTYLKAEGFKITNSTIDDDKTVSIIGTSEIGNLYFILKKDNGKYVIVNSKGLAADFNTSIYKYCKRIGCIGPVDYDKDIAQICSRKQPEFDQLVSRIKENIESNVKIQNNTLSRNYGYLSGEVTFKNYSRFTIPGSTYEIYYIFFNSNNQIVFTKKELSNFEYIPFGQSVTENLFESNTGQFEKIKVELKLISTKFIENVIAENVTGNDCKANFDF